jgi:hypothetical protein
MLLKIIVYLAPIYIGIGLYINWVVHHKEQSLIHKTILFMFFVYTISVIYLTLFPFPLDQASLEFIQQFGYEKGMINLIPSKRILSLYKELGGTILSLGSDAHQVLHLGEHMDLVRSQLRELGFEEYCTFEKMVPQFHAL